MKKWILCSVFIMVMAGITMLTVFNSWAVLTAHASGDWWEKLGKPEYGGQMTFAVNETQTTFDPYPFMGADYNYQYEPMFYPDWTVDRDIWSMQGLFVPEKYFAGHLAESWEVTDPQTVTVHLRKAIHWQNKPPVNGREFTAEDVVFHYDRLLGTGHGYASPSPIAGMMLADWEKVTSEDKYTVVYHFKKPCSGVAFFSMSDQAAMNWFEAPEWVALGGPPPKEPAGGPPKGGDKGPKGPPPPPTMAKGPLGDWKNAVGTGPWVLSDFVSSSSVTYSRNPDYWGNDPRYPENRTPYADILKMLVIKDAATKLAALRTGKIDILGGAGMGGVEIGWQQAGVLKKSDLNIMQMGVGDAFGIIFRNDKKPFTDIRVRKALDMAIDRKTIAKTLYGGTIEGTPTGMVSQSFKGWCYSYEDWPQELKDEYAYNPEKSRKLLADAGYPNGFKTNVVTMGSFNELLEVYKAYFKDINVDMEIRVMDSVAFSSFTQESKHDQIAEGGTGSNWPPTRTIELNYSKGLGYTVSGINDPVYDEIRNRFWDSSNEEEAAKAMQEADKRSIEQHYGVYMVHDPGYVAWQPYLKGYSGEVRFWSQQVMWSRLWVDSNVKKSMGR